MHPIDLFFFLNFGIKSITSNPLAMKLNSAVYAPYERQHKRDVHVLQYLPYYLKNFPLFEHRFLPPPPSDNDRVWYDNAMLAFPQKEISHYTTGHTELR